MSTIHLLNTHPGDCTIIQHASDRVTMLDICDGNNYTPAGRQPAYSPVQVGQQSNFRMCNNTTNPIDYAMNLGINHVFRFILSHPDMDHMDGFDRLLDAIGIGNFWDSGSRRAKPNFSNCPYLEVDWDRYVKARDGGEPSVTSLRKTVGDVFPFANLNEDRTGGGDGLYILAPDQRLLNDCNMEDDINDGSYVILYKSVGGRILLPGDAHDNTWSYIAQHSADDVRNCSFMLAPHHGRDSDRSYDFLDVVRPQLTLIGCAPCECIEYHQWSNRGLDYMTSNQTGNVVLEADDNKITVYVENVDFAISRDFRLGVRNRQGYAYCGQIDATS